MLGIAGLILLALSVYYLAHDGGIETGFVFLTISLLVWIYSLKYRVFRITEYGNADTSLQRNKSTNYTKADREDKTFHYSFKPPWKEVPGGLTGGVVAMTAALMLLLAYFYVLETPILIIMAVLMFAGYVAWYQLMAAEITLQIDGNGIFRKARNQVYIPWNEIRAIRESRFRRSLYIKGLHGKSITIRYGMDEFQLIRQLIIENLGAESKSRVKQNVFLYISVLAILFLFMGAGSLAVGGIGAYIYQVEPQAVPHVLAIVVTIVFGLALIILALRQPLSIVLMQEGLMIKRIGWSSTVLPYRTILDTRIEENINNIVGYTDGKQNEHTAPGVVIETRSGERYSFTGLAKGPLALYLNLMDRLNTRT